MVGMPYWPEWQDSFSALAEPLTAVSRAQGLLLGRYRLSSSISNSIGPTVCVNCLEDALLSHSKPEIFNSDHGSQGVLIDVLRLRGIPPAKGV
jgi:hypothetical protein